MFLALTKLWKTIPLPMLGPVLCDCDGHPQGRALNSCLRPVCCFKTVCRGAYGFKGTVSLVPMAGGGSTAPLFYLSGDRTIIPGLSLPGRGKFLLRAATSAWEEVSSVQRCQKTKPSESKTATGTKLLEFSSDWKNLGSQIKHCISQCFSGLKK